jgi:hypothetical protein
MINVENRSQWDRGSDLEPYQTTGTAFPRLDCPLSGLRATDVPTKAVEYRAKADECERLAGQVTLGPAREEMLEMARYWRRQAEEAERHERR